MAICPFAKAKLIDPGSSDPRITPRVAILHVDAGGAKTLYSYFKYRSGGIESHFHIRWTGVIEQYRDTDWQADANYRANDFGISIETQGFGNGRWTKRQRESIQRLLLWLHETHGIPLRVPPAWDSSGVGYHIQFGTPGYWTNVAKSCPGPERITQYRRWLVPWMRTTRTDGGSAPSQPTTEPTTPPEDDMPTARELLDEPLNVHDPEGNPQTANVTLREALTALWLYLDDKPETRRYTDAARKSRAPKD